MAIRSMDPRNGKLIRSYAPASAEQVERCLALAAAAAGRWAAASFAERAQVVRAVADGLERNLEEHARRITQEMGKPIRQARQEVAKCAWACRYFADNAERLLAVESVPTEAWRSWVRFDPLGPLFAIMPWNFPYWQVFRFAAPALLAGNPILLKHAPNVPACALAIEREWRAAGAPRGVFQVLLLEERDAARVIADERVVGVTLTGSDAAGRAVAALAGRHLKKTVLELGGSDAFLVLGDAPVGLAAERAAEARLINSGQSCIAAKRIIVEKRIAADFLAAFTAAMGKRQVGDPFAEETEIGPLARADLRRRLHQQVRASVQRGARVLLGGKPLPGPGFYYPPTVLTAVRPGMPAFEEELFGPVAAVLVARDAEQAVQLANATPFGLGASLWTQDLELAERLAAKLEVGAVHVNELVHSDPRLPFGGVKRSGYGRELGSYGIKEFVNIKSVVVQRLEA